MPARVRCRATVPRRHSWPTTFPGRKDQAAAIRPKARPSTRALNPPQLDVDGTCQGRAEKRGRRLTGHRCGR